MPENGTLLYTLKNYALWTGDLDLIVKNWDKIKKTTEFPLKEIFRHKPSGMFFNSREYWERHKAHGIENGIELMYQVFPSIGLSSAAILARLISKNDEAVRWDDLVNRLKESISNHPEFVLVDSRGFIKRRGIDGAVQETITP